MNKNVLILSESEDQSTCDVMIWIEYLGANSIRINSESKIKFYEMAISKSEQVNFKLYLENDIQLNTDKIGSFWFRKGHFVFDINQEYFSSIDKKFRDDVTRNLQLELNSLRRTVYEILKLKHSLGHPNYASVDKLTVLIAAKNIGLEIPNTLITTRDKLMMKFRDLNGSLITKSIGENLTLSFDTDNHERVCGSTYTEEIAESEIKIGQSRFPTCVQEKLDKEFDIRIFYLNGTCYSMAIFSQLEEQTSVDFRKYNEKKTHRVSPYLIPNQISNQIVKLMKTLNLDNGSLDFVLTKEGRYVFLEVNPVGQFGMVSYPCNYQLEKKIAQYLLNHEKETN